ncbi:unnamed protein product, partial [marine sediment metagenome]
IISYAGKVEDLAYFDNPNELSANVPRCRWVRYRMEGGGGPQRDPLVVERGDRQ